MGIGEWGFPEQYEGCLSYEGKGTRLGMHFVYVGWML